MHKKVLHCSNPHARIASTLNGLIRLGMQVNPLFADVSSTLLHWSGFKRNLKRVALFLFRHLAAAPVHALHMSRIEALPHAAGTCAGRREAGTPAMVPRSPAAPARSGMDPNPGSPAASAPTMPGDRYP
jgi:hypothetical protein